MAIIVVTGINASNEKNFTNGVGRLLRGPSTRQNLRQPMGHWPISDDGGFEEFREFFLPRPAWIPVPILFVEAKKLTFKLYIIDVKI